MPCDIYLSSDGRILFYVMSDPVTMAQILDAFPLLQRLYDQSPHIVNGLVEASNFHNIPLNILRARKSPMLTHPNSGQLAVVDNYGLARRFAETMFSLMNYKKAKFFTTREDAIAYLNQVIQAQQES
jgi:hypothetical protein